MRFLTALAPLLLLSLTGWGQPLDEVNPLQATGQVVPILLEPGQGAEVQIDMHLPEGYRAYADQFALTIKEPSQFKVGRIAISPLKEFFDETTKKNRLGVIQKARLIVPIEAPTDLDSEANPMIVRLTYQACTKTFCLFPATLEVPISFKVPPALRQPPVPAADSTLWDRFKSQPVQQVLENENLALVFVFLFIAGFLTSLTPCIFPMIPITMSVLGRQAHARTKFQNYLVAHVYVLGIALTYSLLGVFAASTGALFGSTMSSPWVLGFVCLVFLAMSLSMFGLFDMQPPQWLQNRLGRAHAEGYSGAFLMGVIAGLVASPCVGPVLVGVLTWIAQTGNLWLGFGALFVFALGMGQLFLLLGLFSGATKLLPKSGEWMDGVKHFFGLLMLGGFYYYLSLLIPVRWFEGSVGLGLILLGSLKGGFEPNTALNTPWKKIRKGMCQALVLIGAALIVVSLFDIRTATNTHYIDVEAKPDHGNWQNYSEALLVKAAEEGKPVILDFYADWCAACKELEQITFADPRFKLSTANFMLLRFDATNGSPELDALKKKYKIVGLPTVIFHDAQGKLREDLTLTEFEAAAAFIKRVDAASKSSK
ncbi:MAG: protein-disulfide reductase DsbD [Bdellovibrio sp.]|jgi:thiol:disulfide interchange protein DsbD